MGRKLTPTPSRRVGRGDLKSKGSSKGDKAERDGNQLLTSPSFASVLCNTVHLDRYPLFTSKQQNPKNTKTPPHSFCFSYPSQCTQNVTGTQVCTPLPKPPLLRFKRL